MNRLVGCLAALALVASTCWAADDYPYKTSPVQDPCLGDAWGFCVRNCTSFVAWRVNETDGVSFTNYMGGGHWGDAQHWDDNAAQLGYAVNTTPAVGAIAQWNAYDGCGDCPVGHVAWVESVNENGTVDVEEYNFLNGYAYGTRTNVTAPRYIHVQDLSGPLYRCGWVTNSPEQYVHAGDVLDLTVKYRNTGSAYWTNNQNVSDPHSVELWSCDYQGNIVDSWFDPVDWIGCSGTCSRQRVTGADEVRVDPDGIATFSFMARVPLAATAGDYRIWFRPTHGGQRMDDWGGMNILVHVEPSCQADAGSLVSNGQFNGSGCWTVADWGHHAAFDFGTQLHAAVQSTTYDQVQVTQLVSLEAGSDYRISFNVRSSGANTIVVGLINNQSPWQSYGYYQETNIGTEQRVISDVFTADHTDAATRLMFGLGAVSGDVWLDNVRLERLTCDRPNGALIGDAGFQALDCWRFQHRVDDALAIATEGDGARSAHIFVAQAGPDYDTQLYQQNIHVVAGRHYRLTCKIKGTACLASMHVQLSIPGRPLPADTTWHHIIIGDPQITSGYAAFSQDVVSSWTDSTTRLSFCCGASAGDYWIRDISLTEHEDCSRSPGDVVAAGDFGTASCWGFVTPGGRTPVVTVPVSGTHAADCIVSEADGSPWSSALVQDGVDVVGRWTYKLSAQVRASVPGPIDVRLSNADGSGVIFEASASIGTSWTTVSKTGTAEVSSGGGRLAFGLGRNNGEYWVRQVSCSMYVDAAGGRDKYLQPFATHSIWNMPIGSGARLVPAGLWAARGAIALDPDYWITTVASDPIHEIYDDLAGWRTNRCSGTTPTGVFTHVRDSLIIPDVLAGLCVKWPNTPNASAAILQPDGRTLVQVNALARCIVGGPIFGVPVWDSNQVATPLEDIYGTGITGGHGGSYLSSIGGTIRRGELVGAEPIHHALKVDVFADSLCWGGQGGYRWPAAKSDHCWDPSCTDPYYHGTAPATRMGSLLTFPASLTADQLGIETTVGRKLFQALHDYGAYIVDNAGWNAYAFCTEDGVREEAEQYYGYSIDTQDSASAYFKDGNRLFRALMVVDNNSTDSLGGGGMPRAPLSPELIDPSVAVQPGVAPVRFGFAILGAQPVRGNQLAFGIYGPPTGFVVLSLYAVDGRRVAELFRGSLEAGHRIVNWNGRVPAGMYFARLLTPQGNVARKVVMVH